jgi:hypothetical protein
MKKTSFTIASAMILAFATNVYAQESKNQLQFIDLKSAYKAATATGSQEPSNLISTKAARNFHRSFKNVNDENWFPETDGFVAEFMQGNIETRVYYDKKGHEVATIRYYTEDLLPKDVRHIVKSEYYDFSIGRITEVTIENKIGYVMNLEDKTSIKQIKVVDGEMEVMHEYKKSE